MAENSENIEAKLCAYVEGDLDDNDRLEIERHLEANPKHRHLLRELAATRDLLRYLPREQAPPELAESFNSHLERSVLLDGAGTDEGAIAGSIGGGGGGFLRPLLSLAAVLILAVLLGVIAFVALPRGNSNTPLAMPLTTAPTDGESGIAMTGPDTAFDSDAAATAPGGPGVPPAGASADSIDTAGADGLGGRATEMDKAEGTRLRPDGGGGFAEADAADESTRGGGVRLRTEADGLATGPAGGALRGAGRLSKGGPTDGDRLNRGGMAGAGPGFGGGGGARGGGAGGIAASEPVYVIVSADDPTAAVRAVTANLRSNSITWEDTDVPGNSPEMLAMRQQVQGALGRGEQAPREYAEFHLNNALEKKQRNAGQAQLQLPAQQQQPSYATRGAAQSGSMPGGPARRAMDRGRAETRIGKTGGEAGTPGQVAQREESAAAEDMPPAPTEAAEDRATLAEREDGVAQGPAAGGQPDDPAPAEPRANPAKGVDDVAKEKQDGAGAAEESEQALADAGTRHLNKDVDEGPASRDSADSAAVPTDPAAAPTAPKANRRDSVADAAADSTDEPAQAPSAADDDGARALFAEGDRFAAGAESFDRSDLRCIVAYDLTPEQAIELSEVLAGLGQQQVEVIAEPAELLSLNRALQGQNVAGQQVGQQRVEQQLEAREGMDEAEADAETAERAPAVPETNPEVATATPAAPPAVRPPGMAPRSRAAARGDAMKPGAAGGGANEASKAAVAGRAAGATRPSRGAGANAPVAAAAKPTTRDTYAKAGVNQAKQEQKSMRYGGPPRLPARIQPGERLSVTVDELAGPDTDKTVEADVAADGTVRLSKLEKAVKVQGLTRDEAAAAIADAYREAEVVDAPTVSVERYRSEPARAEHRPPVTRTPAADALADAAPPPAPAEEPPSAAPAPAPADAPVAAAPADAAGDQAAASRQSEQRVNVVILVQRNAIQLDAATSTPANGSPDAKAADAPADEPVAAEATEPSASAPSESISEPAGEAAPEEAAGESAAPVEPAPADPQ